MVNRFLLRGVVFLFICAATCRFAPGALVTNPNDGRSWQGATVGTFAALYYGSDTLANRTLVVNSGLLDDGILNTSGFSSAPLLSTPWANGTGLGTHPAGDSRGYSTDLTGTGSFGYVIDNSISVYTAANTIDNIWFQSSNRIGETVFDLGPGATQAAIFNTIDHDPLPYEAIESTVYLSNDLTTWTQAVVERVFLEGFKTNTGILWDGFSYIVGTGTNAVFRYASVIHGGPGALVDDGDNEINGVLGAHDFVVHGDVPEPASLVVWSGLCVGLVTWSWRKRRLARVA